MILIVVLRMEDRQNRLNFYEAYLFDMKFRFRCGRVDTDILSREQARGKTKEADSDTLFHL